MSFVHPVYFAALTAVAVSICFVLGQVRDRPITVGTYRTIDGLRGYLTLFVFFHHAAISYLYVRTGHWTAPPSNLSVHLGQASVSLFFMITAFLFYGKVIDNKSGRIDWLKFFVGRVCRLTPLYAVVVMLLLVIMVVESHGILNDTWGRLIKGVIHWFLFTVFDEPIINGQRLTTFMAGVNWSLPYEWYFYVSLPLLALSRHVKVEWPYLAAGIAMVAWAVQRGALAHYVAVFACGVAAAWLVRWPAFARLGGSMGGSIAAAACIAILVAFFDTAYGGSQLILLGIAFSLIAAGANFFGILLARASHVLGELAYSIYLLHGMLLFIVLKYVVGYGAVRAMAPSAYWLLTCALLVPLLLLATAAFRFIEAPAMRWTPSIMTRLRGKPGVSSSDPLFDRVERDTGKARAGPDPYRHEQM